MSKLGSYNLDLQEQANNFGFSTTQEALDAGYTIGGDCDEPKLIEPLESAHKAWEAEKKKVLEGLDYLLRGYPYSIEDAEKIADAIKFVESCHE